MLTIYRVSIILFQVVGTSLEQAANQLEHGAMNNGNCTGNQTICNHKFDFRPKLHNRKWNFRFIIFILKSTNGHISLLTQKHARACM